MKGGQAASEWGGAACLRVGVSVLTVLCPADVALDREVEGDLVLGDMGQGMPFKAGTFDGCIRYRLPTVRVGLELPSWSSSSRQ